MKHRLTATWQKTPALIRKPVVLVVGLLLILAAILTGWLPGPGGIPLFLLGIAVLATEFEWAQTVRDWALRWLKRFGHWFKANPLLGTFVTTVLIFALIGLAVLVARYIKPLIY